MSSVGSSSGSTSPVPPYIPSANDLFSSRNPSKNSDGIKTHRSIHSSPHASEAISPPPDYSSNEEKQPNARIIESLNFNESSRLNESFWITSKEISMVRQLPYLTGMRALATIMIEIFHITREDSPYVYFFTWLALTTHFVQGAFLITGSLLALQSKARTRYGHLPQFFANRWVRLYPAAIVVLFINSIWWLNRYHNVQHLVKMLIRVFFKLTQTNVLYIPKDPANPFANMWFLDVQEHFYLFWALLLPFISRFTTGGKIVCLTILFLFSFRQRIHEGFYNATLPLNLYKMVCGASLYLLPLPRNFVLEYASQASVFVFIIGFVWGLSPRFVKGYTEDQHRMQGDNFGIILTVLIIMASIGKSIQENDPDYQRKCKAARSRDISEEKKTNWLALKFHQLSDYEPLSILDANWLQFVGRISYSWYLWQVPLMHLESNFRSGLIGFGPTCEAFVLSLISTFFIEEPIKNAYSDHRKRKNAEKTVLLTHANRASS